MEKCLFRSSHFFTWLFVCILSHMDYKFWRLILCHFICNIFSHSVGCLLIYFVVSFTVQNVFNLIWYLFFFFLNFHNSGRQKKLLLLFMFESVLPMFSSKSFIVSDLTFRSLMHFEFIFVHGVKKCSKFHFLYVAVQFSQEHLLKILSLLCCIILPSLM